MALGVETAGLQSTTLQRPLPHTTRQMVVDIRLAGWGDKHQPIRVVDAQQLHLHLVLSQHLQHLQHLSGQGHHTLSACLGRCPAVMT